MRHFAETLLAVAAVWLVASSVPWFAVAFAAALQAGRIEAILPPVAYPVSASLIGVVLFAMRRSIAGRIAADSCLDLPDGATLRRAAYAVAGAYLTAMGLSNVLTSLAVREPQRAAAEVLRVVLGIALYTAAWRQRSEPERRR